MNSVRSWAEAVAVRGERIVYVGPDAEIGAYIGPGTRVVDLDGKMVLPSFQDSHIHPVSAGVNYRACALYDLTTKGEYLEAIEDYAAAHPDLPWILGGGWSMDAFAPSAIPDGSLLDAIVPDRPVYLSSSDGHSAWVNSKALEIAGITRETPDPEGGRIDRDPGTGELVGGLQEPAAMNLVRDHAPLSTPEEKEEGLRYALKVLNGYGITAFQDAAVYLDGKEPDVSLDTYRALERGGELTARVVGALWYEPEDGLEQIPRLIEMREKYAGELFRPTAVKIMQDGVMEMHTAALMEPYVGKGGATGFSMVDPEVLKQAVTRIDKEGFQVHFHAIGDRAIRECLDAVETARRANGRRDSRHHISHIQLFHPDDIPRFRQLDVVANFQPLWAFADEYITELTLPYLDEERARWIYPIGSLVRSGAVVAFGSDWYVSSANPLEEIEVAVTRLDPESGQGEPYIPEERIALRDALAAFTLNAAYVNFLEDETGSIEIGKLADLIVLDRNLFEIEPGAISDTKVLLTLMGGRPVHGDPATL
jgi:predicted amidohydrolase YtcJ